MSLQRVALAFVQAVANQMAFTPPNPTQQKQRYHTEEPFILQVAPYIFRAQGLIAWVSAAIELLLCLISIIPPAYFAGPIACSLSRNLMTSQIHITPLFLMGVFCVILGTIIRLDCFRALGPLFTFDLTVHPTHCLVTKRCYSIVRHPAYTGSLLTVLGLSLSHMTAASWITEFGPAAWVASFLSTITSGIIPSVNGSVIGAIIAAIWLSWSLCVGISRARAEDQQMKKLFGTQWEAYAAEVRWWFVPGLI